MIKYFNCLPTACKNIVGDSFFKRQLEAINIEDSYYITKGNILLNGISIYVSSLLLVLCVLLSSRGRRAATVAGWLCFKAWKTKGEEEMFLQTEIWCKYLFSLQYSAKDSGIKLMSRCWNNCMSISFGCLYVLFAPSASFPATEPSERRPAFQPTGGGRWRGGAASQCPHSAVAHAGPAGGPHDGDGLWAGPG